MIDAHVHIERGPYTFEWLLQFVRSAQVQGIDELIILEHSFRFFEFKEIYESMMNDKVHGNYQRNWLNKRCKLSISDYKDFITKIRLIDFPIKVLFGLEVCFFPEKSKKIEKLIVDFEWDNLTGSIHWIDGWGFDHPNNADTWKKIGIDDVYRRYYDLMISLSDSQHFHVLAHPDSIKCFNYYPTIDLSAIYDELSKTLLNNNMKAEFSCGLKINYQHSDVGPNAGLLKSLILNNVELVTASDAHRPEDVGLYVGEANEIINNFRMNSRI